MALPQLKLGELRPKKIPAPQRVQLRDRRPAKIKRGTGGQLIEDDQARAEALRLRLPPNNLTYPQIAEKMGCSLSTAHSRVNEMWGHLIENIIEMQIQVKADAMLEIELMKQQLRPYIVNEHVTIMGVGNDGEFVLLDRWKAMHASVDRMTRLVELQLKLVGVIGSPDAKSDEKLGQQTLNDAVMRHIAAFIIEKKTHEKRASSVREV